MDDTNNPSIPASSQPTIPDPMMTPPSQPMMETTPPMPESPTMTATPMPEAPMPEMPMPGPLTQPTASQFGGQATTTTTTTQPMESQFGGQSTTTTSTTTETLPPTTTTPEVQWPGAKPKSKLPKVLGGIAAIILVVGVATAAYFVSSKVGGRQAVAPTAPESEPFAMEGNVAGGGSDTRGTQSDTKTVIKDVIVKNTNTRNNVEVTTTNPTSSSTPATKPIPTTTPASGSCNALLAGGENCGGGVSMMCNCPGLGQPCTWIPTTSRASCPPSTPTGTTVSCPTKKTCPNGTVIDSCTQTCPTSTTTTCTKRTDCPSGTTAQCYGTQATCIPSDPATPFCASGHPCPEGMSCTNGEPFGVPGSSFEGRICEGTPTSGGTSSGGGTVAPTKKPGGGGGGGGTTTTTTTTTATGGACMELFIYQKKADGTYGTVQMTKDELSRLKIGDKLRFAVKGNKDNLKSRYMVYLNNVAQGDWLPGGPADGLFSSYSDYEIKSAGNYKFEAQVQ